MLCRSILILFSEKKSILNNILYIVIGIKIILFSFKNTYIMEIKYTCSKVYLYRIQIIISPHSNFYKSNFPIVFNMSMLIIC